MLDINWPITIPNEALKIIGKAKEVIGGGYDVLKML